MIGLLGLAAICAVGWLLTAVTMWRRSRTDELTHLGNRAALRTAVTLAALRRRVGLGGQLAGLLLLDLNDFKAVNDQYGHRAGDAALIGIAARLRTIVPFGGGLPVRLHGDEFAVWLGDFADFADFAARRSSVMQALSSIPVVIEDGRVIAVSCSVGWAVDEGDQAPALGRMLAEADQRMYAAKQAHHSGNPVQAVRPLVPRETRRTATREVTPV
jgi:diguanylate cyclase (GGDEF)-like protein